MRPWLLLAVLASLATLAFVSGTALTLKAPAAWTAATSSVAAGVPFSFTSLGAANVYFAYVYVPNADCATAYNYEVKVDINGGAYLVYTGAACTDIGALSTTAFGTRVTTATTGQDYQITMNNLSATVAIAAGIVVLVPLTDYTIDGTPVTFS